MEIYTNSDQFETTNNQCDIEDTGMDDSETTELVSEESQDAGVVPQDHWNIVYILFYLFGVTSLIPWNFIITANDYWMYKFRDVTPKNGSVLLGKTQFQAEFTSYLNVATAVPNLIFLIINSLYSYLVHTHVRMIGSLSVIALSFIITTIFVQIDTDDFQDGFFIITMVLVVFMTAASAIFTGGLYGIAGKFAPEYMAAVVSGQSLGGIIAAVAQIISLAFKISPLHSAIIYFLIADMLILACLITYTRLKGMDFFLHYYMKESSSASSSLNRHREVSTLGVLKKIWPNCFNIFAVFAVSMSVYPAVTVLVESHPVTKGTDWNNIFFVPVVNYLIFNCGDYSGRIIAGLLLSPDKDWIVSIASIIRIIGVPLLMLCNAQPRHHLPVIFQWDYEYIAIMIVFALSNGYLTNITFINSCRRVENEEKEKASSLIATMLALGLTAGASSSVLFIKLL